MVAGSGWRGRGLAMRAKGGSSNVAVTEVDPLKSIEAVMDVYQEMPMVDATKIGDGSVVIVRSADCELRNAD